MTTMTFELGFGGASSSPRRAAARRNHLQTSRTISAECPPVAIATIRDGNDNVGSRRKLELIAVVGCAIAIHTAIIVAINQPALIQPIAKAPTPPLTIEMAPIKQPEPPPVIQPKPLPQVAKAPAPIRKAAPPKPVVAAQPDTSTPIVSNETPVEVAQPTPDTVQVATTPTPAPVAAPVEQVTEPRGYAGYRSNPAPSYPSAAQKRGLQGQVVLKVHILASGQPDNIDVAKSSGHAILDEAAVKAVATWVFDPAKRGQTPIDGWVRVPLIFKLNT
ncbi:MAG TPA: energy transducer TonB [Burkholderiales bacterium]|nr:energy transducer TonB [Burkholderiales bacterium]